MSSSGDSDDGGDDRKRAAAAVDEDDSLPALFWDTMPDDPESHPDFAALQALAEESTPEERAENFKVQGNNKVKVGLAAKNKHVLREAADFYGKGVAMRCGDPLINAALLSNRAHVQLLLGNWRHALRDAEAAARLRPDDPKARHRACRAALELDELARAAALLRGVGVEVARGDGEGEEEEEEAKEEEVKEEVKEAQEENKRAAGGGEKQAAAAAAAAAAGKKARPPPLPPLHPPLSDAATRAEFEALARRLLARRQSLRRERERERLARERAMRPARELARAVLERGVRLAAPAVNRVGSKSARPRLCRETNALRWPVVFMYPEAPHAPDVIEDAGEDDLIADHLDVMFADDAPPLEWERETAAGEDGGERRYTRAAVELYYMADAGAPLADAGATRVEQEEALAHALHWGWPDEEPGAAAHGDGEEGEGDDEGGGGGGGGGKGARREKKKKSQPRFARLDAENLTIGESLLLPGHVVAGVPVFWVVARGTEYYARWRREAPILEAR